MRIFRGTGCSNKEADFLHHNTLALMNLPFTPLRLSPARSFWLSPTLNRLRSLVHPQRRKLAPRKASIKSIKAEPLELYCSRPAL